MNIVIDERRRTESFIESNSLFEAPPGTVMTGRSHVGDENGATYYEYATLKGSGTATGVVSIKDERWEFLDEEKRDTDFDAPVGRVIIGRKYEGDENGCVKYKTGVVYYNNHKTETYNFGISEARHENGGWNWFVAPDNSVITGKHHYGDETGNTYYCYGHIRFNNLAPILERLRVIVMMDPSDSYFPMRPDDFIKLSRFRRHVEGGSDDGYSKSRGCFVIGNNDHTSEYYNIPVSVINSYHTTGEDFYFNLRPRDKNSVGKGEVFLEPDDNLRGDTEPTGRVPVYYYSESGITLQKGNNGQIQLFVFFGFNEYEATEHVNWNHQGDWEEIRLSVNAEGRIEKAWLSQHGEMKQFESDKLDISYDGTVQVLKVYCHRGTHAFSNEGEKEGYPWIISRCALPLLNQPWQLYEGAWGEVGIYIEGINPAATTGPLGPTKMNNEYSDDDIKITDLIKSYEVLLIPYNRAGVSVETEKEHTFVTDENMVITGRRHSGDETQATTYEQASLMAVDINGNVLDYLIEIVEREWVKAAKESLSGSYYIAPEGYVITGRKHSGDENGYTQYQIAKVYVNHRRAKTSTFKSDTFPQKFGICESAGILVKSPSKFIITGRTHTGDENGRTYYYISYLHADIDPE